MQAAGEGEMDGRKSMGEHDADFPPIQEMDEDFPPDEDMMPMDEEAPFPEDQVEMQQDEDEGRPISPDAAKLPGRSVLDVTMASDMMASPPQATKRPARAPVSGVILQISTRQNTS